MFTLKVNGKRHEVEASPETPLLWVLREELGITSVKYGCGVGECGCCTVLVDGNAERSCTISAESVKGQETITIEGLPVDHPIKQTWISEQVPQCGYCQPGMMLQAVDVITRNPSASRQDLTAAMDDVICRCGTYSRVITAIERAASKMKSQGGAS
jgi:isoquinoline 1-oxidoreductase alpha subunit